jgi:hypothetical protein
MSVATIIAIIQALISLAAGVPELVSAGETAIALLRSGAAPSVEQQAQIDAALQAANAAIQAV